jgi:hypothetical protein
MGSFSGCEISKSAGAVSGVFKSRVRRRCCLPACTGYCLQGSEFTRLLLAWLLRQPPRGARCFRQPLQAYALCADGPLLTLTPPARVLRPHALTPRRPACSRRENTLRADVY